MVLHIVYLKTSLIPCRFLIKLLNSLTVGIWPAFRSLIDVDLAYLNFAFLVAILVVDVLHDFLLAEVFNVILVPAIGWAWRAVNIRLLQIRWFLLLLFLLLVFGLRIYMLLDIALTVQRAAWILVVQLGTRVKRVLVSILRVWHIVRDVSHRQMLVLRLGLVLEILVELVVILLLEILLLLSHRRCLLQDKQVFFSHVKIIEILVVRIENWNKRWIFLLLFLELLLLQQLLLLLLILLL